MPIEARRAAWSPCSVRSASGSRGGRVTKGTSATRKEGSSRLKRKEYDRELRRLHGELVALQEWVKETKARICVVFEGRDTAGKGGTIKAITERVSPRVFRVVALPAPNERERSQMFMQRYVPHLPAGGEVVIFDRSWYNRAGIERVLGFCTEEEATRFLESAALVERTMVESGIILLKYWLEVSSDEQTRRLESRINDPRKVWKLSDMELKSYSRWWDYEQARDEMFRATDTSWAPWNVAHTDDKRRGRLEHHQPPAQPDSLRASRASCGRRSRGAKSGRRSVGDSRHHRYGRSRRRSGRRCWTKRRTRGRAPGTICNVPGAPPWLGMRGRHKSGPRSRGEYAGRRPRRSPADGAALHGDVRAGGGHVAHERVDLGGDPRPQDHGQRCAVCHCPRSVGLGCVHPHQQQDRRPHRPQARLHHRAVGLCRGCPGNDIDAEHHATSSSSGRSSVAWAPHCSYRPCSR